MPGDGRHPLPGRCDSDLAAGDPAGSTKTLQLIPATNIALLVPRPEFPLWRLSYLVRIFGIGPWPFRTGARPVKNKFQALPVRNICITVSRQDREARPPWISSPIFDDHDILVDLSHADNDCRS